MTPAFHWSSPCSVVFCRNDSGTYLDGLLRNWPRDESVIVKAMVFLHCDGEHGMVSIAGVEYTMCRKLVAILHGCTIEPENKQRWFSML